jgi:hypothetical protein
MNTTTPDYLLSSCAGKWAICYGCEQAIKSNPVTGRYFITMGHPGFNSNANNADGYPTRKAAVYALMSYGNTRPSIGY